jgi:CRP-like cAMP-binding protein
LRPARIPQGGSPPKVGDLRRARKTWAVLGFLEFSQDSVIFSEGYTGDLYYIVLEGTVRIEIAGVPVRWVDAGEGFGDPALSDGGPRTATAIAETDCKLFAIGAKRFDEMITENPNMFRSILLATLKRLRLAEHKIVELTNA